MNDEPDPPTPSEMRELYIVLFFVCLFLASGIHLFAKFFRLW